jgi:outer membrane lipoprotein-sorting protein
MSKRILLALAITGIARPDSLADVLTRLDTAAKGFRSYSADVKFVRYEKILDDKIPATGSIRLQRGKNGISGIVDLNEGEKPSTIHVDGPKFEQYFPKANDVQFGNMRKLSGLVDQMLLLGFSVTREEMTRDYEISLGGLEKVDSMQATRIVLTPKSAETLKSVKSIELWVPDGMGYPIQEKVSAHNGDYKLATYSNLHLNPTLPPSAFELPPAAAKAKRTKLN